MMGKTKRLTKPEVKDAAQTHQDDDSEDDSSDDPSDIMQVDTAVSVQPQSTSQPKSLKDMFAPREEDGASSVLLSFNS
jgi:hypothetical protein